MANRARSRARGWALQVLYAGESRGGAVDPEAVLEEFLARRRIAVESRPYLRTLVEAVITNQRAIDEALEASLTNWRLERLSAVDRTILRIGAAEMLFLDDVPPRVAMQEGIILAEKYGTSESPRFVNGVLDALARARGVVSGKGRGREE